MPASNYFELFGLTPSLNIDPQLLESQFHRLSRQWHPDLFARKSPLEQKTALDRTAEINDAYRTLRDPIKRAEYFLGPDPSQAPPPPELLEEVFELNLAIEEGNQDDLHEYLNRFEQMRSDLDTELFSGGDSTSAHVRALLNKRKYLMNLIRDTEKALHA